MLGHLRQRNHGEPSWNIGGCDDCDSCDGTWSYLQSISDFVVGGWWWFGDGLMVVWWWLMVVDGGWWWLMSRTKVITAWGKKALIRATGAFLCQCADADPTMWRGGLKLGLWYGVHQWSGDIFHKKPIPRRGSRLETPQKPRALTWHLSHDSHTGPQTSPNPIPSYSIID